MEICSKKTKLMNWRSYNGAEISFSYDVYVSNFFCGVTLIYLEMMMSCFLSFFAFPSSLVTWKDCVKG